VSKLDSFPSGSRVERLARGSLAVIAAGVIALSGCSSSDSTVKSAPIETVAPDNTTPEQPGQGVITESDLSDPTRFRIASKIISTFENSTTEIKYGYAEDIEDGRGITAGRAGFTSGTGDMLMVVRRLTQAKPNNPLAKFIPALEEIDAGRVNYGMNPSTKGLAGLPEAWRSMGSDSEMQEAQDSVFNELYVVPAQKVASEVGLETALGELIILDTAIQQGAYDDPDGLLTVVAETGELKDEETWLRLFLENRRKHLLNANDPDTRQAWRESVDRVNALMSLIDQRKFGLETPIVFSVYGDTFTVEQ